jgi:hypothetical protein
VGSKKPKDTHDLRWLNKVYVKDVGNKNGNVKEINLNFGEGRESKMDSTDLNYIDHANDEHTIANGNPLKRSLQSARTMVSLEQGSTKVDMNK